MRALAAAARVAAAVLFLGACYRAPSMTASRPPSKAAESAVLDDIQERTFRYFWEPTNPRNGLVPDRWPTQSFSSIAAVGFGLTAYPIGVERGYITRDQARDAR